MRAKSARRFIWLPVGIAIGFVAIPGGCGDSTEGTTATFSPEADKKRQDSMREYMQKQGSGLPGQDKAAK
jgi:hypothetical protein